MNQIPTNRPPTSRPPKPKYQGRPIRLPKKCAPPKALVITTTLTAILLVISIMTLSVALLVGPTNNFDNDSGGTKKGKEQQEEQVVNDKIFASLDLSSTTNAVKKQSYSSDNFTAVPTYDPDIPAIWGLKSQAAALLDVTNKRVVAGNHADEKIYPASMTKVMTLLVAIENANDPAELLTVTEEMVKKYKASYNPGEAGPSIAIEWKAGYQVTVETALYLVIYESDTYACWLLAEHVAGSEAAFVRKMNERAASLGLSGTTHFENCTGLYHDNHYTTCIDMAVIMAAAMSNNAAKTVLTSTDLFSFDVYVNGTLSTSASVWSGWFTGRLEKYPYGAAAPYYAGNGSDIRLIAGKTGYETIPKYCFVTAGQNEETGTLFVCVQVGGTSPKVSTDETREIYQKFATY